LCFLATNGASSTTLGSIGSRSAKNTAVSILLLLDGWLQQPNGRNVLRFTVILLLAYKAYVFIDSRGADSGQPALLKRREGSPGSGRSSSGQEVTEGGLEKGGGHSGSSDHPLGWMASRTASTDPAPVALQAHGPQGWCTARERPPGP